ncbi:hypothetical protein FB45DRAFT_1070678 [Roridomyces roridus]|uniref:F-box domain-containing protein n=1 Tax=Roridomyces roridus TaxID=1738132 RepID=A0AAD7F8I4_9AGAR|nr:hypothetical protein FB45DRAFT_1070678 [Roridomyces roridus]
MDTIRSRPMREAKRARMAEIDAQIHRLQTERGLHEQKLAEYAYPVLSLPNEIVSEILIQSLPSYPACPPLKGPSSPTSLTHICRQWRDIALATPQLWRAIPLRASSDDKTPRDWLERSGSCPLSIKMESDEQARLHPQTLAAILLHHERWERAHAACEFTLQVPNGLIPRTKRPRAHADFPRLRTLSLDCLDDLAYWFPWTQLTSLTLTNPSSATYFSTLQGAVNLVHLKTIDCYQEPHAQLTDVTLPRLETFIMVDTEFGYFEQGLGVFILPSLRTLQVPAAFLGNNPLDTFASFVAKSGCTQLQKVLITGEYGEISKPMFRSRFPGIIFAFNSRYDWHKRRDRDEEDSSDSESE